MELFEFRKENRRLFLKVFGIKLNFVLPFGGNNKIILVKQNGTEKRILGVKGVKVKFHGSNAIFKVYEPIPHFIKCKFTFADNSLISIKSSTDDIRKLEVMTEAKGSKLIIGENFGINSGYFLFYKKENNKIEIGDDCMFSKNITIRTCDGHNIRSIETGEIINEDKDIKIGNHVWLGQDVSILKGVEIPDNTIIAFKSVVTKRFSEENTILAGIPAKIVKTNVNWERK